MQLDKYDALFKSFDLNNDGFLELDEFMRAISVPSPLEQFICATPLCQILSDAFPRYLDKDPIRSLCDLTSADLDAICKAFDLKGILVELFEMLKDQFAILHNAEITQGSKKFAMVPMPVGCIDDFHKGLVERIGILKRPRYLLCLVNSTKCCHFSLTFFPLQAIQLQK
jgi:hypothetical protein